MFKKNLIGIIIVVLVFAGFYAGYILGKGSGASPSGMRPGMRGVEQTPSSSSPASQQQGMPQDMPQTRSSGDGQWVNAQQGKDEVAPASSVVNVAWAEPLETPQAGEQIPENEQQNQTRRPGTLSAPQEEQETSDTEIPVQQEETLDQEQTSLPTQTFYGTVVPYAEVNVQSKQGGTITLLKGKEGDLVKKGEVLIRFDERDAQLDLQQAMTLRNSALQQVNQAESNFQTIQSNVKRYRKLSEDGFVSKQEVDNLQNQLASATSSLNSAKESVTQHDVQIKMLQNTLRDLQVKAPISGLIDEKNYNLGEIYQGNSAIYHLIDIDRVYVEVEVPETYLKQIREGMKVHVVFDAVGDQLFSGTLETILPSGTADNRNFTAKVLVQNPELRIKPGMFARIEVSTNAPKL